eukprot:PLAT208.2.p1 GENE.PLAT208.2~~PLAT208.2.p1  ORF type:complete len:1431 (+),score=600.70 PLAT208.2:359-4294(+)
MEDARNMTPIRRKHQARVFLTERMAEVAPLRLAWFALNDSACYMQAELDALQSKADRARAVADGVSRFAASLHHKACGAELLLQEVLRCVPRLVTLRSSGTTSIHRTLLFTRLAWEHKPDLSKTTAAERAGMNALLRTVACVTHQAVGGKRRSEERRRLIVTVRQDTHGAPDLLLSVFMPRSRRTERLPVYDSEVPLLLGTAPSHSSARLYDERRDAAAAQARQRAQQLVRLLVFGPWQGELRVRKLPFLRTRQALLTTALPAAAWWQDVLVGRSSRAGVLQLCCAHMLAGRCFWLQIWENCGAITFCAYEPSSLRRLQLRVPAEDIAASLAWRPKLLQYWHSCVRCCRFSHSLLRRLAGNLQLRDDGRLHFLTRRRSVMRTLFHGAQLLSGRRRLVTVLQAADGSMAVEVYDFHSSAVLHLELAHVVVRRLQAALPQLRSSPQLLRNYVNVTIAAKTGQPELTLSRDMRPHRLLVVDKCLRLPGSSQAVRLRILQRRDGGVDIEGEPAVLEPRRHAAVAPAAASASTAELRAAARAGGQQLARRAFMQGNPKGSRLCLPAGIVCWRDGAGLGVPLAELTWEHAAEDVLLTTDGQTIAGVEEGDEALPISSVLHGDLLQSVTVVDRRTGLFHRIVTDWTDLHGEELLPSAEKLLQAVRMGRHGQLVLPSGYSFSRGTLPSTAVSAPIARRLVVLAGKRVVLTACRLATQLWLSAYDPESGSTSSIWLSITLLHAYEPQDWVEAAVLRVCSILQVGVSNVSAFHSTVQRLRSAFQSELRRSSWQPVAVQALRALVADGDDFLAVEERCLCELQRATQKQLAKQLLRPLVHDLVSALPLEDEDDAEEEAKNGGISEREESKMDAITARSRATARTGRGVDLEDGAPGWRKELRNRLQLLSALQTDEHAYEELLHDRPVEAAAFPLQLSLSAIECDALQPASRRDDAAWLLNRLTLADSDSQLGCDRTIYHAGAFLAGCYTLLRATVTAAEQVCWLAYTPHDSASYSLQVSLSQFWQLLQQKARIGCAPDADALRQFAEGLLLQARDGKLALGHERQRWVRWQIANRRRDRLRQLRATLAARAERLTFTAMRTERLQKVWERVGMCAAKRSQQALQDVLPEWLAMTGEDALASKQRSLLTMDEDDVQLTHRSLHLLQPRPDESFTSRCLQFQLALRWIVFSLRLRLPGAPSLSEVTAVLAELDPAGGQELSLLRLSQWLHGEVKAKSLHPLWLRITLEVVASGEHEEELAELEADSDMVIVKKSRMGRVAAALLRRGKKKKKRKKKPMSESARQEAVVSAARAWRKRESGVHNV